MKAIGHSIMAAVLLSLIAAVAPSLSLAAELSCAYKNEGLSGSFGYTLSSDPQPDCIRQKLKIVLQQGGKTYTHLVNGSNILAESSWIDDLAQDGIQELVVVSGHVANSVKKSLDIYTIESGLLKHIPLPDVPDKPSYRGGDEFRSEGGKILRTYSVYRANDPDSSPSGGQRTLTYQFRNNELLLAAQKEHIQSVKPVEAVKVSKASRKVPKGTSLKITGIGVKADYIEIQADGEIENHRIMRLSNPWRLVVDIPDAQPVFSYKSVNINRHGVSTVRIGANKGFLRIVFDATIIPMPPETITPAENALRVSFYPVGRR